jgi:CheY-like chemotaxis protein
MTCDGPIILIDDDDDDLMILKTVLKKEGITNKLKIFTNGLDAFSFLKSMTEKAFLILCDINMPKMSGLELRDAINEDSVLKEKSIPFVFFTTSAAEHSVQHAYKTSVQGFFEKGVTFEEVGRQLRTIVEYWKMCKHPNIRA